MHRIRYMINPLTTRFDLQWYPYVFSTISPLAHYTTRIFGLVRPGVESVRTLQGKRDVVPKWFTYWIVFAAINTFADPVARFIPLYFTCKVRLYNIYMKRYKLVSWGSRRGLLIAEHGGG